MKQIDTTSRFRFRLTTLLLLMIPMAGVSFAISLFVANNPINWIEYSSDKLANENALRHVVLVFYTADWDPTAKLVEDDSIDTFWIRRLIRKERVIPMRADCTDWQNNSHDDIPDSIQFGATPIIAIYNHGNREQPVALLGNLFTEEELYNALAKACH